MKVDVGGFQLRHATLTSSTWTEKKWVHGLLVRVMYINWKPLTSTFMLHVFRSENPSHCTCITCSTHVRTVWSPWIRIWTSLLTIHFRTVSSWSQHPTNGSSSTMSNSTSAVPPPMTIFRSLPRPTKSKISVSDALGTSKTSLEVWFIFKSLFNFTSSTTVRISSTRFYDLNRKIGFSKSWLYFLWVLKYPTNCFLCFNIKNVITFSVIFNNNGSVQSLFRKGNVFVKLTLKWAKIEVLRFRYELRYEQKMRFRSHFETFPAQGSTDLPVRIHPLVRTS